LYFSPPSSSTPPSWDAGWGGGTKKDASSFSFYGSALFFYSKYQIYNPKKGRARREGVKGK